MVYLTLSERITAQVLKTTWCKSFALAEVLIMSSRSNKYLRTFARVITRCLRNHLLNCILVVNLILNGLRRVIMLLNLILQPKDWSATSLRQTRMSVKIAAGTGQKLFLAAALVQQFLPASNLCSRWTEMWQIVNSTRRWRNSLGRRMNDCNSNANFHRMGGKRSSRS